MFSLLLLLGLVYIVCQIINAIGESKVELDIKKRLMELEVKRKEEEYEREKRKKEKENLKKELEESITNKNEYYPTLYIDLVKKNCIITFDFLNSYSFNFNEIVSVRIDTFAFNPRETFIEEYDKEFIDFLYTVVGKFHNYTFEEFKENLKKINLSLAIKCLNISFKDITREEIKVYFMDEDKDNIQLNKFKYLFDRLVEIGQENENTISDL